jgi:lysophospholipase L1-like esterase
MPRGPGAASALLPLSSLFFADYSWAPSPAPAYASGSLCASAPGAALRASFTGSASIALAVDAAATANGSDALLPLVAWSVDSLEWRREWAVAPGGGAQQQLLLASGLDPGATHTLQLVLDASSESGDRWRFAPAANQFLCVAGLVADAGAAALPPALRPRRMLVYGDSITEGTSALRMSFGPGSGPGPAGDTWGCTSPSGAYGSSALHSWASHVSDALGAELSMAAFAAQGYATKNSYNYGNVPPLMTPGDDAASAWRWVFANASRLPALAAQPPDFVFNAEGWNDQVVAPADLTPVVAASLAAIRGAIGARAVIFQVLPFGGLMCDNNVTRGALMAGFAAYKATAGGAADACALLLDPYPLSQEGITGNCNGNVFTIGSCEGTHPNSWKHARIGAIVASKAARLLVAPGAAAACGFGDAAG